jgi:hypothetical protein
VRALKCCRNVPMIPPTGDRQCQVKLIRRLPSFLAAGDELPPPRHQKGEQAQELSKPGASTPVIPASLYPCSYTRLVE